MGDTDISWTHRPGTRGRSWNPGQGCSRKSEGCRNCYAERLAARFAENGWSKGLINLRTGKWNGTVRLAVHKLDEPLRWREPSTVFVNSMTDMFHENYSNTEIAAVFGVMAACPQHTFQILTKRAARMRNWFEWIAGGEPEVDLVRLHADDALAAAGHATTDRVRLGMGTNAPIWPLSNVWLGVSVENQDAADERIPELLNTPAAIRFLSCEPLLGPLVLHEDGLDWLTSDHCRGVDWVIAGCESGPGARPCEVEWLRSIVEQCIAAGVPPFLKQAMPWDEGRDVIVARGIGFGPGSDRKGGGLIERPYLDGAQHLSFPEASRG